MFGHNPAMFEDVLGFTPNFVEKFNFFIRNQGETNLHITVSTKPTTARFGPTCRPLSSKSFRLPTRTASAIKTSSLNLLSKSACRLPTPFLAFGALNFKTRATSSVDPLKDKGSGNDSGNKFNRGEVRWSSHLLKIIIENKV